MAANPLRKQALLDRLGVGQEVGGRTPSGKEGDQNTSTRTSSGNTIDYGSTLLPTTTACRPMDVSSTLLPLELFRVQWVKVQWITPKHQWR